MEITDIRIRKLMARAKEAIVSVTFDDNVCDMT